jgi:hypothetical protein
LHTESVYFLCFIVCSDVGPQIDFRFARPNLNIRPTLLDVNTRDKRTTVDLEEFGPSSQTRPATLVRSETRVYRFDERRHGKPLQTPFLSDRLRL